MYDLVPPSMKAQFNLINKPNQSIKLSVNVIDQTSSKKDLVDYKYNKIVIFKYSFNIKKFSILTFRYLSKKHLKKIILIKTVIGSFIYDNSIKYSISLCCY